MKNVIIYGGNGVGKTLILITRALEVLERGEKILFLVIVTGLDNESPLLGMYLNLP